MSLDIKPETERLVLEEIRRGHFRSADELIVSGVKAWREKHKSTASSATPLKTGEAMLKIAGLWVHQGQAELGADWDRVVSKVRDERISDLLKASSL